MSQLISRTKYLHPVIQNALVFVVHIFSVGVVGAALFMFGFYVIPVFGDTSLKLSVFSNKQISAGPAIEQKQDLQRLLNIPSKRALLPYADEDGVLANDSTPGRKETA